MADTSLSNLQIIFHSVLFKASQDRHDYSHFTYDERGTKAQIVVNGNK